MNRRSFLQTLTFAAGVSPFLSNEGFPFLRPEVGNKDEVLCRRKFGLAVSKGWEKLPIGEVVVNIGKTFLGTPYKEHVLEAAGEEHLVVNMRALDCVTFCENALALARCVKMNKMTFDEYRKQLQLIRYRGGVIDGFASRLHYTSDYFYDGEKKEIWKLVTKDLGGIPFVKKIDFMSTHAASYPQIRESEKVRKQIEVTEQEITNRTTYFIPKNRVAGISDKMNDGDILGITTSIEGIDTSHSGIAIREKDGLHLMHAPLAGKEVQISENVLSVYLALNKRQTGIMVARPLEPV